MSLADIEARDPVAAWSIARTMRLEGGLVDNPADPGSVTNFGISLRAALATVTEDPSQLRWFDCDHDGHVTRKDIEGLTPDEAAAIYFESWWQPYWFAQLSPQLIAWKCFDIAVNAGPKRSATILQRALCAINASVARDAVIGPVTVAVVKVQAQRDGGDRLIAALRAEQAAYYRRIVLLEPKLEPFLAGWLNRAAA